MTPRQAAQAHCANWNDGQCAGMDFDNKGNHFAFRKKGRCWLCDPIERCSYFESAVMPMNVNEWKPIDAQGFIEAVQAYRKKVGSPVAKSVTAESERTCPICKTRTLEPRHRYCYICADKLRKETQRESKRRVQGFSGDS